MARAVPHMSQTVRDMAEAYRQGETASSIAKRYGVPTESVSRMATRYGWQAGELGIKRFDGEETMDAFPAAERVPHAAVRDVFDTAGFERATAASAMRESLGLPAPPPPPPPPPVDLDAPAEAPYRQRWGAALRRIGRASVVHEHRVDLYFSRQLLAQMKEDLGRLATLQQHVELLEEIVVDGISNERDIPRLREAVRRALSVHQRAQTLSALVRAERELHDGERRAVGIRDDAPPPREDEDDEAGGAPRDTLEIVTLPPPPPPLAERVEP